MNSSLEQPAERQSPGRARIGVDRRTKALALGAVALLHIVAIALLVRALGADAVVTAVRSVTAFAIPLPPPPPPPPEPQKIEPAAAAPAAPKARPKEVVAPKPKIAIPRKAPPAPPVAGIGNAAQAGAASAGTGSGAGGFGTGSGSGAAYVATKAVKVAGDIVSARDYPRESREAREGAAVVIALTVGTDGRVKGCAVVRASPDAQADAITCRLATKRFRFRPAQDQNGRPIESSYGWRQSWFR